VEWVVRTDGVVDLTRTVDGRVRCTLCFGLQSADAMFVDLDGRRWDVCTGCASEASDYADRHWRNGS